MRDVTAGSFIDGGLCRGPERVSLGVEQKALEFLVEIELRIWLDHVVETRQRPADPPRPYPLIDVPVDHVVLAGLFSRSGLPAPDLMACLGRCSATCSAT